MSAATIKARAAKAAVAPRLSPVEAAFNEGRDMVVALVTEARAISSTTDNSHMRLRRYRMGQAQNRFAEAFLQRLIDKPECVHGFAAALSSYLGSENELFPHALAVPMAEYMGGTPGEDGTEPVDEDEVETGIDHDKVVPELQPKEPEADFGFAVDQCDALLDGLEGLGQLFDGRFSKALTYTKLVGSVERFSDEQCKELRVALGRFTDMCESLTNEIPVDGPRYTYDVDCLCAKAVQHAQESKGIMAQLYELFVNAEEEQPLEVVSPAALCNVLDVVLCCLDQVRDNLHEAKKLHG